MFIQLIGIPVAVMQQIANPRTGQITLAPTTRVALFALDTEGIVWEYGGGDKGWSTANMKTVGQQEPQS